jgi:DNA-binding transcriptional ArsR family regulator
MGASKSAHFSEAQNALAAQFKALAHPARVAIVEHLMKTGACVCGDLVGELPLAQPTVSQHLKELKSAGLIRGSVEGKRVCYCIHEQAIVRLREYFSALSKAWETAKNSDTYLI